MNNHLDRFWAVVNTVGEIVYGATTKLGATKLLPPFGRQGFRVVQTDLAIPRNCAQRYKDRKSYHISNFKVAKPSREEKL